MDGLDVGSRPPTRSGTGTGDEQVSTCAAVLGVAGAGGAGLLAAACWHHVTSLAPALTPAGVAAAPLGLELVVTAAAGLVAAWLALVLLAAAVTVLPGHRAAWLRTAASLATPGLAPRVATALATASVVLLSAGGAQAQAPEGSGAVATAPLGAPTADHGSEPAADRGPQAPEPGWRPTSPPRGPGPGGDAINLVSRGTAEPDAVVVHKGDTLWDITAHHLGPEADAAQIAQEWPRWHAANRDVIGADPDLLLPGMRLLPPPATDHATGVAS
ncbi:LysM peptidoglycan-binding domain-containing protein [Ornithinimicrobium cavernae]|uniref:LysM peptidoglycan-binding domain-containing protein n=1 Tax=Ornithinimicrobium cavernae TaxID=2666047 RepID=UPI00192A5848|nr:hypothetical protein [Ornithinimicrobium cavernae]